MQMNYLTYVFYYFYCDNAYEQDKLLCLLDSLYLTQGIHMHIINYSHKSFCVLKKKKKHSLLQQNFSNLKISKDFLCYIKILIIPTKDK